MQLVPEPPAVQVWIPEDKEVRAKHPAVPPLITVVWPPNTGRVAMPLDGVIADCWESPAWYDSDKENAEPTAQNKTDKVSSILAGLNNPKRITTGYKSSAPGNFAEQQKRLKEAEQKRLAGIS